MICAVVDTKLIEIDEQMRLLRQEIADFKQNVEEMSRQSEARIEKLKAYFQAQGYKID